MPTATPAPDPLAELARLSGFRPADDWPDARELDPIVRQLEAAHARNDHAAARRLLLAAADLFDPEG